MADERLPDFLYGTFMQYKQHTGVVRDWLLDNASGTIKQSFGLLPTNIGDNNEQESDYNTTVGPTLRPTQYLPITRNILQPPRPTISASLIQSLRTSIDLRSEFVTYFADFTHPDVVAKNRSHVYFVNVLRQVLALLLPHQTAEPPLATPVPVISQEQTGLTEQLASVVVADPEHEADEADSEHVMLDQDLVDEDPLAVGHEAAQASTYKMLFAGQCFLKDFDRLQDFIDAKWMDYAMGRLELDTAAAISDVAVDMAVRIEDIYLKSIGLTADDANFEELYKQLNDQQQSVAAHGSIFALQPAFQLAKCLVHNLTEAYSAELTSGIAGIRHGMPKGLFDPALFIDTSDRPTDSDFTAKLSMLEHTFKDSLAPCIGSHSCCSVVEDQILGILRVAFVRSRVRMSTAFAVNVFLIIRQYTALGSRGMAPSEGRHILAEVDAAAIQFKTFWNRAWDIIKATKSNREGPPEKSDFQLRSSDLVTGILDGHGRHETGQYFLQTNIRRYLVMNPVACGLFVAWFRVRQKRNSLFHVDQRQTVLLMLHFYWAAKQGGATTETWEDMEHLIRAHGTDKLFHGDLPQTYEQCINQFRLSFDISLDLSTMYEGRGAIKPRKKDQPKEVFAKDIMPMLQLFSQRSPEHDVAESDKTGLQDIELALLGVSSGPKHIVKQSFYGTLLNRPELFKLHSRTARRTPLELLEGLQQHLRREQRTISFGYNALEERCWELLDRMRTAMKEAGLPSLESYNSKHEEEEMGSWHMHQLALYIAPMALMEFANTNTGIGLQEAMDNDRYFAAAMRVKTKYNMLVGIMADFIKEQGDMGVKRMKEADD